MPKAGTPQTPPQAPKASPNDTTLGIPEKTPEISSATPSAPLPAPVPNPLSDIPLPPPNKSDDEVIENAKALASEIQGETADPHASDMEMGTPANPRRGPFPPGKVTAYALVRAEDGMWRAVQYKIIGNVVVKAKTKEPDLKALLAAQITDCLALDTPLFNDEEGPRE